MLPPHFSRREHARITSRSARRSTLRFGSPTSTEGAQKGLFVPWSDGVQIMSTQADSPIAADETDEEAMARAIGERERPSREALGTMLRAIAGGDARGAPAPAGGVAAPSAKKRSMPAKAVESAVPSAAVEAAGSSETHAAEGKRARRPPEPPDSPKAGQRGVRLAMRGMATICNEEAAGGGAVAAEQAARKRKRSAAESAVAPPATTAVEAVVETTHWAQCETCDIWRELNAPLLESQRREEWHCCDAPKASAPNLHAWVCPSLKRPKATGGSSKAVVSHRATKPDAASETPTPRGPTCKCCEKPQARIHGASFKAYNAMAEEDRHALCGTCTAIVKDDAICHVCEQAWRLPDGSDAAKLPTTHQGHKKMLNCDECKACLRPLTPLPEPPHPTVWPSPTIQDPSPYCLSPTRATARAPFTPLWLPSPPHPSWHRMHARLTPTACARAVGSGGCTSCARASKGPSKTLIGRTPPTGALPAGAVSEGKGSSCHRAPPQRVASATAASMRT